MELNVIDSGGAWTEVALIGRADSAGIARVETRFYAVVIHAKGPALVDLSGVPFLASLGIRMLVAAAKMLNKRGAKLILHSAPELVASTLRDAGIDTMIPLAPERGAAIGLATA